MREVTCRLFTVAILLAATAMATGVAPMPREAAWAVILTSPAMTSEADDLETATQRMAAVLRTEYDFPPGHVIDLFGDVDAPAVSSAFQSVARGRGIRTTVLVYFGMRLASHRYESGGEIYLVPWGRNLVDTWRLIPLSRMLRLLPPDAAVTVVLADCLDEQTRFGKYLFDVPPTEMPRVTLLTLCPSPADLLFPTRRMITALQKAQGPTLTVAGLAEGLQSGRARVYLVQDAIGGGPPFELRRRDPDPFQSFAAAMETGAPAEEKIAALQKLVDSMARQPSSAGRGVRAIVLTARKRSEPVQLRYAAIDALARLRASQAAPDLIGIAVSPDEEVSVRIAAMAALDKLPVDDRAAYVEKALADAAAPVRVAAVRSMRAARDSRFAGALATLIRSDENDDVRVAALQSVGDVAADNPAVVMAVREAMQDGRSPAVKSEAVLTWGRLQQSMADPLLAEMLRSDADTGVRETVVLSLGRFEPDAQSRPAVEAMLQTAAAEDMPREVRRASMMSWQRIGGERAVGALTGGLSDPDDTVKLAAISGLSGREGASAVPRLVELAASPNLDVRRAVIRALGEIGDPAGAPVVRAALKDEDSAVRDEALVAIQKIGAPATDAELLEQLVDRDPVLRQLALSRIDASSASPAVVDQVIQLLGDPDAAVRQRAVAVLSGIKDDMTRRKLAGVLADGPFLMRASAAEVLGNSGDPAAAPLLRMRRNDGNGSVRSAVVRALSRLPGREEDVGFFLDAGADLDPAVRLAAIEALGTLPPERSRTLLKRLANDDSSDVRAAAAAALSRP